MRNGGLTLCSLTPLATRRSGFFLDWGVNRDCILDNLGSNRVSLGEQKVKLVSTKMISQKTIWIDKDAFYPLVAVPLVLFFLFVIGVTGRLSSAREVIFYYCYLLLWCYYLSRLL